MKPPGRKKPGVPDGAYTADEVHAHVELHLATQVPGETVQQLVLIHTTGCGPPVPAR